MKKYTTIPCLILICLLFQCKDETEEISTAGATISLTCKDCTSDKLPYTQGSLTIGIVSTTENWSTTEEISWLEIVKFAPDSIRVNYDANPTATQRQGEIIATIEGASTSISIMQQAAPAITLSSRRVEVDRKAGDTTLTITSLVGAWQASEAPEMNWLQLQKRDTDQLQIQYYENTMSSARTATIQVSVANTSFSEDIVVIQMPNLQLSSTEVRVMHEAGDTTLMITSADGTWQASEVSNEDWLSLEKTDERTLSISYQTNNTARARTVMLRITVLNMNIEEDITFTQLSRLSISDTQPSVYHPAGSLSLTIQVDGGSWIATEMPEVAWLSVQKAGDTQLTLTYQENNTSDLRTTSIQISIPGTLITETLIFSQQPPIRVEDSENRPLTEVHLTYQTNSAFIRVYAPEGDEWRVLTTTGDWITRTLRRIDNERLVVEYTQNDTGTERSGTVTLRLVDQPGIMRTLTLRQRPKPILTVPPSILTHYLAGDTTVTVEVSAGEWRIKEISNDDITAKKIGDSQLRITYPAHNLYFPSSRSITVESIDDSSIHAKISLLRTAAAPIAVRGDADIRVGFVNGDTTIRLTSVGTWTATTEPAVDWVSLEKTSDSALKITYTAPPEDQQTTREAHIKISAGEHSGFLLFAQSCFIASVSDYGDGKLLASNGTHIVDVYANEYYWYDAKIINHEGIVSYSVTPTENSMMLDESFSDDGSLSWLFTSFTPNDATTHRDFLITFSLTVNGSEKCSNTWRIQQQGWGIKINSKLPNYFTRHASFCAANATETGTHTFTITQEAGSSWDVTPARYSEIGGLVSYTKNANSLAIEYDMSKGAVVMDILIDNIFVGSANLINAPRGTETCTVAP